MNPNSSFSSAKIYAFPAGGRATLRARLQEAHLSALGVTEAPPGSGWYHDAAMREEEMARKPRSAAWWDDAESESQAKGVAVKLY
ncbi:MAG TPA: DUF2735 domain-containing protein [Methylovirgula sp.]